MTKKKINKQPYRNEGTELMIRDVIWSDRAIPKLYNQEIIKRKNRFNDGGDIEGNKEDSKKTRSFGQWFNDTTSNTANWNTNTTSNFFGSNFGQGLGNLGINSGNIGGIANTAATVIGGALAGGKTTGVGNALQGIGSLASNIPGVGGLIGAGVNLLGGGVNALFGSKLNTENIAAVEDDIKEALNYTSNVGDYDALASNYAGLQGVMGFDKDFIGSDGLFSNKAKKKYNSLKTQAEEAEAHQLLALTNNAQNIAATNQQLMEANYSAYGGPIDMKYTGVMSPFGNQFKDGGIFIKPSKRGTFTAAAKKRGMGVQEFASKVLANKEDYSTAMVKKANFARNASKWKHDNGGPLDTRMKLLRRLEEKRRRDNYGGGEFGGAGASSIFLESPDDFTLVKDTIWVPYRETFNDAFGKARAAGLDEFMFDNKAYTTELGDNPDNNRAGEERVIEGLLPIERTRQVKNKKANGGQLFTNGVTMIGNGGTHEQNPMEGVPMGIDNQGIPNLVEEGEVIYDDYVFSNRLRVPKEIRQKYKLRGVTFADAAKQLQKESEERPNDPISKRGLNATMTMLQQEQETIRMKKESNKYAKGGKLGRLYDGTGGDPNWLYKPVTSGFTPSKDDILAEMEDTYSFLNREEELPIAPLVRSGVFKKPESTSTNLNSNSNWLRYAPIVGHGLGVFSDLFSSPDYSAAETISDVNIIPQTVDYTPIGNYLEYTPFDRDYYLNKLNANTAAGRRAVMNTSGGNRAAAMAGLLATDYNYGTQLGDLARKAEEYNLAQRQAVETFNRGTNMANAEMGLKAAVANAEARNKATQMRLSQAGQVAAMRKAVRDAYDARRSNNINVLLEELGGLGTENWNRDWLDRLAKAGVLKIDSKGNPIISSAKGGKIRTKKKKGFIYG